MELPEFPVHHDGEIRIAGSRIGLAHVVRAYNRGDSAEMIALRFPTLSLATIHHVIPFYLDNAADVDAYVAEDDRQLAQLRRERPGPTMAELRVRLLAQQAEQSKRGA